MKLFDRIISAALAGACLAIFWWNVANIGELLRLQNVITAVAVLWLGFIAILSQLRKMPSLTLRGRIVVTAITAVSVCIMLAWMNGASLMLAAMVAMTVWLFRQVKATTT